MKILKIFFIHFLIFTVFMGTIKAVTKQQFIQSLDMMRNGCAPKFKIPVEVLDKLRIGEFAEGMEGMQDLKCYTRCIAQLAGTLTKKGELSVPKALAQFSIILPAELQQGARDALESCKDMQKNYKESCDKIFYITKCMRDFSPSIFSFP